jgi:hypothetical protein
MKADRLSNGLVATTFASLAAGPVFMVVTLYGEQLQPGPWGVLGSDPDLRAVLAAIVAASFVGTIVSFLPNLIGVYAMGRLGGRNVGLRHPAIWGLGGAALAAIPFVLSDAPDAIVQAVAGVGAGCALVARLFVTWRDSGGRLA